MAPASTPERSASEISRPIASVCEAAQPPALPIWANTSKGPAASWLMVT